MGSDYGALEVVSLDILINKKRPSQPFGIKMGRPTKHRRFKFSHSDVAKPAKPLRFGGFSFFVFG
jgi:hypothetical protein